MAREYAFLNPGQEGLYSPATTSSTTKLLPHLLTVAKGKNPGSDICLTALDIKDAFLQVEQETEVAVTLYGQTYRLLRVLPGQRSGPQLWFNAFVKKLKENFTVQQSTVCPCVLILEKDGYKAQMIIHVDDALVLASKRWVDTELAPILEKSYTLSKEQLSEPGDSVQFLKRTHVMREDGSVEVRPSTKYIKRMAELCGIPLTARPKPTLQQMAANDSTAALDDERAQAYRSIVGIGLYLSADRPDIQFPIRLLGSKVKSPTELSWKGARRLAQYLIGTMQYTWVLQCNQRGSNLLYKADEAHDKHYIEVYCDADWSGVKSNRRSISSAAYCIDGNLAYYTCRVQRCVSLSSCESDWCSAVSAACDGLYLQQVLSFLCQDQVDLVLKIDNFLGTETGQWKSHQAH